MSYQQPNYDYQTQDYPAQYPAEETPKKSNKRTLYIVLGVVAALLVCCCLVAIILYATGVFDRFLGGTESTATVVSAESELYASVNLLNLTPEKLNRVLQPFEKVLDQVDVKDQESALKEIDNQLDDMYGITITEDVMPWVGQYAAISIDELKMGTYGAEDTAVLFVVEVRNKNAADEFILKLIDGIEDYDDVSFDDSDYEGVTVYSVDEDYTEIALCRYNNFVLLSNKISTVEDAISLKKSDSMAQNAVYKSMLKQLPTERALTMFLSSTKLIEALSSEALYGSEDAVVDALNGWKASTLSLAIVDAGVQVDMVTAYDVDKLDDDMKAMMESGSPGIKTIAMMPEETMVFVSGSHLDLAWNALKVSLIGMGDSIDFEDAMVEFEDMMGFDPDTELLAYLDGEFAISIFPSKKGILSEASGVDLGFVGLFGTSKPDDLRDTVNSLVNYLEDEMYTEVNSSSVGDGEVYELDMVGGAFGVVDKYLGIGSSVDSLEDAYDKTSSITDNETYKEMLKKIPGGLTPVMFVNVTDGLSYLDDIVPYGMDSGAMDALDPIQYLVMSGSGLQGDLVKGSFLIAIEPVK